MCLWLASSVINTNTIQELFFFILLLQNKMFIAVSLGLVAWGVGEKRVLLGKFVTHLPRHTRPSDK